MAQELVITMVIVILIWISVLTYFLRKTIVDYNLLTRGVDKKNLDFVLEKLVRDHLILNKNIENLMGRCDKIEKDSFTYIQKIGFMRFNPFKDTGGDQSFVLTLSDANKSGIVITGLYSRNNTRWYVKRTQKGHGVEHELSEEEIKTLNAA